GERCRAHVVEGGRGFCVVPACQSDEGRGRLHVHRARPGSVEVGPECCERTDQWPLGTGVEEGGECAGKLVDPPPESLGQHRGVADEGTTAVCFDLGEKSLALAYGCGEGSAPVEFPACCGRGGPAPFTQGGIRLAAPDVLAEQRPRDGQITGGGQRLGNKTGGQ